MDNTSNNSIKEYYIKLEKMMINTVNILTALNKALSTSSSEINVSLVNTDSSDNAITNVKIPSFLYLENKVEQLDNIINNLFNIPKTGEAWFEKNSNMYKLTLLKSNNAPLIPSVSNLNNIGFNIKDNNIFKDLVNPKTYIKFNIGNLPDNINQILVKKLVLFNSSDADYLKAFSSYSDIKNALFNKKIGIDYEEYDTVLDLPIKEDKYSSLFKITEVHAPGEIKNENTNEKYNNYTLRFDTIKYYNRYDNTIQYTLKEGDLLCLSNNYCVYRVLSVNTIYNNNNVDDTNEYELELDEYVGHITLQTYEENSEMYMQIYNNDYNSYHYIEVPLEENENIILFLSTLYNNVKSAYSDAIHLDLNSIYMKDSNNNYLLDDTGNKISYIEYYKKYCKNIGDLMVGFTKLSYPQISNYTNTSLKKLTDSDELKEIVTKSLYNDDELLLSVSRINSHLIDDDTSKNIINMHSQKNEINSQLRNIQANIDQVYTQLTTTDFSQETSLSQEALRSKMTEYYNERLALEKQFLSIVDNINQSKASVTGLGASKYRIRGITDANDKYDSSIESNIVNYLHTNFGYECDLIGLEIDYKYKSAIKDSTSITDVNNIIFTDWNKHQGIERERFLKFDPQTNKYVISYSNYNSISNVIKWNQIDIPINQGEDVVLRIRYKYNIGQPFINLYTPWSDEVTVKFPAEYTETNDISSILDINDNDVIKAKFLKTLIEDGYEDHTTNKIIDNSQVFYHLPENIYSGFTTPENNLISLKDQLISMNTELTKYKSAIETELNINYKVYLEWDNNSIELSSLTTNNIVINELVNGSIDTFVKKKMNLIIKNVGSVPINLYSIFPGNIDTPLIETDNIYFNKTVVNYERVPMLLEGSSIPSESIIPQYMGQWIYFRQNNPFTNKSLYYDDQIQRQYDVTSIVRGNVPTFTGQLVKYLGVDNAQALLPYRSRVESASMTNFWGYLEVSNGSTTYKMGMNTTSEYTYNDIDKFYIYNNIDDSDNTYVLKYEHFINTYELSDDISKMYLSNKVSITDFIKKFKKNTASYYKGAFLIPELVALNQILCDTKESNQYKLLDIGKAISIPILFEYFLIPEDNASNVSISKTIAFDLKPSLLKDPEHYILTVTAKYDYSQTLASTQSYSSLIDGINNAI